MSILLLELLLVLSIVYGKETIPQKHETPKLNTINNSENLPNILFIMADDLGWGNVGFHNSKNEEINTPTLDNLVKNGLELDRHYVYSGCSPTRASMQSGRLPVHVTINNGDGLMDPTHGIPKQMTGVATKLKEAGYQTHLIGKWDAGFNTYAKLPAAKGYDTFYGYLSKSIGYFTKYGDNDCDSVDFMDLWENDKPAASNMDEVDGARYVEFEFAERVTSLIENAANDEENTPFFIMYSMHLPHYPAELPQDQLQTWDDDENYCQANNDYIYPGFTDGDLFQCRSTIQSQVNTMDSIIGGIIDKLKELSLYENTLIVFTSDNGGSLELDDTAGNNWPLRGGKSSNLEGGIRATALVSGGYLPSSRYGQVETGLMHIADWYTTFCELAGVDPHDYEAMANGLPDIDGLNMWPLLTGKVSESPRKEVVITEGAFISGNYKLLSERQKYAIWQGVIYPNSTSEPQDVISNTILECGTARLCLFDVVNDPSETKNLVDDLPDVAKRMTERLQQLSAGFYENREEGISSCPPGLDTEELSCGCWMAMNNYNYFTGPYQDLTDDQINYDIDNWDKKDKKDKNDKYIKQMNKEIINLDINKNENMNNYYMIIIVSLLILVLVIVFIGYFKSIAKSASKMGPSTSLLHNESYGAV